MLPTITTFGWVPEFARRFVRDMRPRWAFEEVGQPYAVNLITDSKSPEHRRLQPFGQVPTYQDDEVAIFESGAIVLRIAERAGKMIPLDAAPRMRALQERRRSTLSSRSSWHSRSMTFSKETANGPKHAMSKSSPT